jgi:hypothetical protein
VRYEILSREAIDLRIVMVKVWCYLYLSFDSMANIQFVYISLRIITT